MNAISGGDLALWDLLGKLRQEPVYHLLGEQVPVNGGMQTSALDRAGFGVDLNRVITLHRPYYR